MWFLQLLTRETEVMGRLSDPHFEELYWNRPGTVSRRQRMPGGGPLTTSHTAALLSDWFLLLRGGIGCSDPDRVSDRVWTGLPVPQGVPPPLNRNTHTCLSDSPVTRQLTHVGVLSAGGTRLCAVVVGASDPVRVHTRQTHPLSVTHAHSQPTTWVCGAHQGHSRPSACMQQRPVCFTSGGSAKGPHQ